VRPKEWRDYSGFGWTEKVVDAEMTPPEIPALASSLTRTQL
jgi:hypothetical protein